MLMIFALLLAAAATDAFHSPRALTNKRYDGYKVFTVIPKDRTALDLLRNMMINNIHMDFWEEPTRVGAKATFMVSPEHASPVLTTLSNAGVEYAVHVDNVQDTLTPMWNAIDQRELRNGGKLAFDLEEFNTLEDIYLWLATTAASCHPGITCEVYSVGNTHEGRPINIFKISKAGTGRKAYWIDATIHAREWIATSTAVSIINHLALGGDTDAIRLTDAYDWYIMPVMNPDGYVESWTDRYYRKNMAPTSNPSCTGTDLNRNFDFRWGNDGVSFLPCSDLYCGGSAGSELETKAVSAELQRLGSSLLATVTMHSYGNMWMFPWGNTVDFAGDVCDLAVDTPDMMVVANAAADAVERTHSTKWDRGNSCEVIYATTGGTDDYSKGAVGVKYAFCPELRGNDFVIAARHIPLSFVEIWNGVVAMCDAIEAPQQMPH